MGFYLFVNYILACVIFNLVIKVIFVDWMLISSPPQIEIFY